MTLTFSRMVATVTGCVLSLQLSAVAAELPRESLAPRTASAAASSLHLPDAPSVMAPAQAPPSAPAASPSSSQQSSEKPAPQQPKGAAAAEVQPSTGTAASTPSGAAIAPAKQKRSRSLLIRMGALAGAAIAIGTVVALSSGSPSKPPGAN